MATNLPLTGIVEIPISKKKLVLLVVGAVLFVAGGIWFITHPDIKTFGNQAYPLLTPVIGYAAILFFGLCAVYGVKKMFDTKPGLVVSAEGILDNSSAISAGLIPWYDIEDIYVIEISGQKLIMIAVNNPEEYVNRLTNPLKKKLAAINYRLYKTPISISTNSLQYNFEEVYGLLRERLDRSRVANIQ